MAMMSNAFSEQSKFIYIYIDQGDYDKTTKGMVTPSTDMTEKINDNGKDEDCNFKEMCIKPFDRERQHGNRYRANSSKGNGHSRDGTLGARRRFFSMESNKRGGKSSSGVEFYFFWEKQSF